MDRPTLIKLKIFNDHRGWFMQSYDNEISKICGFKIEQENVSLSRRNVFRGLHYQWDKPMAKAIQVLNGKVVDYVVDIRKGSPHYGNLERFELDGPDKLLIVPSGYAHGFLSSVDNTIVKYFCSTTYNSLSEGSINVNSFLTFDDTQIIMSDRDRKAIHFYEYDDNPLFLFKEEQ